MKKTFDRLVVVFCTVLFALVQIPAHAEESNDITFTIKAAFVRKFPDFITWPDNVSPLKNNTVNVCVLGKSAVTPVLDSLAEKAKTKFTFTTTLIGSASQATGKCHIVYLAESEAEGLQSLVSQLDGQPILTISHTDNFAKNGGMIGFELVNEKMRYNVNTKSLGKAGLRIDPQLLEIANKVIE